MEFYYRHNLPTRYLTHGIRKVTMGLENLRMGSLVETTTLGGGDEDDGSLSIAHLIDKQLQLIREVIPRPIA